MIYTFNEKNGMLKTAAQPFVNADTGAGPRHIIFHPNNNYAYLMQELTGTVVAYKYKNGRLTAMQKISAMYMCFFLPLFIYTAAGMLYVCR